MDILNINEQFIHLKKILLLVIIMAPCIIYWVLHQNYYKILLKINYRFSEISQ